MSNTTIKFKRTDFAASIDAIVLQRGEPAVDFDRQILWIGDGDVNLQFAAVDSSSAMHSITSAGESGDVHTVSITKYGSVLKGTASTKASFQRLGFYDLGDIAALPSTNSSFPSQDVSDTTGILSRWHWIEKTHAGPRRSLFVTNDSISGIGTGSNGTGMGNMRHAGGASAADLTGYRVEALSYEYAGDMLMTNPEFDGGGSHVLVVDYTSSLSNNVLKFRRLLASDIEGGSPVHEMTSDSHSCSASMIYYSRGVNDMTSLSFLSGTVAGKVIKRASSTALEWSTVDWSEITGNFNPNLGSTALDNNTMRFDATLGSWAVNKYVNSINNSTTNWNGHEIINIGVTGRTIGTTYKAYNSSNAVISTVEMYLPGSAKKVSPYYIGSTDGGFVFNTKGASSQFLFYAGNDPDVGDVPNFWIRKTGGVRIQATTTHSNLVTLTGLNGLSVASDFEIGSKTGSREIVFDSASRVNLPEYSSILISETIIKQSNPTAVATQSISGLKIDNITYVPTDTALTNPCQPTYMLRLGNVSSTNTTIGARFGSVTVSERPIDTSITGRTACGVYFDSIINNRDETGSRAFGIRFDQITASSGGDAQGITIAGITGYIDAYGLNFSTSISGRRNAYGININSLTNITGVTPSTTASNTVGLRINGIRNGGNVAGISITDITSSDTGLKLVGLFINLNAGSSLHSTSVPVFDDLGNIARHAIYVTGGISYLGGNTKVGGTLTSTALLKAPQLEINGNVSVEGTFNSGMLSDTDNNYKFSSYGDLEVRRNLVNSLGRNLKVFGDDLSLTSDISDRISITGRGNISVARGDLILTSGDVTLTNGIVKDSVYVGPMADQANSGTSFLRQDLSSTTSLDISNYRVLVIFTANSSEPNTISRIKPGREGQRLTIVARAIGSTKPYLELKGVINLTTGDPAPGTEGLGPATVRSNLVINPSDLGVNTTDGNYPGGSIIRPEVHVWYHQPVELVFCENFFDFEPEWISSTAEYSTLTAGQRNGAWVLIK